MIATTFETEPFADVLHRIGDVPLDRILAHPAPGEATTADALRLCDGEPKRLCELVDGVLVEKATGHRESRLSFWLGIRLAEYAERRQCGILTGADSPHHLTEDQVRFPDVSFISWDNIPTDADPNTPMPDWVPSLAVEAINPANSRGEMKRKLKDYFAAGVELVWYLYPIERVVRVYTSAEDCQTLTDADDLDGGDVLPGFRVSVRELFDAGQLRRPTK